MSLKINKIKSKLISVFTWISSLLVPIYQYIPCTAIWFGIMSVPLISYLIFFFQYPHILISDIAFAFDNYEIYIILSGLIMYGYSLTYQITHRKQLIQTGPYKYVRHPQYLAIIIMTFGMTLLIFKTGPIINFNLAIDSYIFIFLIWICELLAYILLAKIEEYALKNKYGDAFLKYVNEVAFMIPFLKLRRNREKNNE
jgi:protein-S-isoprenylcysteine O-methyltransferase Ste14